jgi:hypothetical protein
MRLFVLHLNIGCDVFMTCLVEKPWISTIVSMERLKVTSEGLACKKGVIEPTAKTEK